MAVRPDGWFVDDRLGSGVDPCLADVGFGSIMRLGLILLTTVLIGGCGSSGGNPMDAKADEESRKAFQDEELKKNPPPPGEGPGN